MIFKPSNCEILIGIPIDEESRIVSHSSQFQMNFVNQYFQIDLNNRLFIKKVVRPAEKFLINMRNHGVNVTKNATLADLKQAFRREGCSAVILITHCSHEQLELHDGMFSPVEICDIIPTSFSGVFDITACEPSAHAMMVRNRSQCRIAWRKSKLEPASWFFFYYALFKLLSVKEMDYAEAAYEVITITKGLSDAT